MEDTPKEIELNFDSGNEKNSSETETVGGGFPQFAPAADMTDNSWQAEAAADDCVTVENTVDTAADSAAGEILADTAEKKPVNEPEMLLRSRYPANCPLGTPPLEKNSENTTVTAVDMAISGRSYGAALRILREQNNLSYKELEQITLIQPRFLEALENENLNALPQLVYVIAYIRNLCRFYRLSDETSNALVAKLKEQMEFACNDELMNTLDVDRSGAAANERQLRKILWSMAGIAAAVVAVIILLIVLLTGSSKREPDTTIPVEKQPAATEQSADSKSKFDSNTVYSLLEPPTLKLPKLPVAE